MPTFKITVAYDGTDFVGWQRQATGVSVQGLLENALRELDGRDVAVAGAGRTDAGVHALGQVAGFSLARAIGADAVRRALNARLPDSVRVLAAEDAIDTFHPRFDARAKRYQYRIWNGAIGSPFERRYAWHIHEPLDVAAMDAAARMVEGRHDFAAFQATGGATKTTTRQIYSSLILRQAQDEREGEKSLAVSVSNPRPAQDEREGEKSLAVSVSNLRQAQDEREGETSLMVSLSNHEPLIAYEVCGDGFLRHMVRAIVGTLVEIGRGRQRPEWMGDVIASADRAAAGPTAPAHGLFLVAVDY